MSQERKVTELQSYRVAELSANKPKGKRQKAVDGEWWTADRRRRSVGCMANGLKVVVNKEV